MSRAKSWDAETFRREHLIEDGYALAENVVRRYGPFGRFKHDFLDFGDLMVQQHAQDRLWLEQVTVKGHLAEHIRSALANPKLRPKWIDLGRACRIVCYPDAKVRSAGDFRPALFEIAAMPSAPGLRLIEPRNIAYPQ